MNNIRNIINNLPNARGFFRLCSSLLMVVGQRLPFLKPCASLFLETQSSRCLLQLAVPVGVTYVGTHSLSGASVAVVPAGNSKNPAAAPLGKNFKWFLQSSGGHQFKSFTVTGLPPGLSLSFGDRISSIAGRAKINGKYKVSIIGWEGPNRNGRRSPTYKLNIQVGEVNQEIVVEQPRGSSLVDGMSTRDMGSSIIGSSGVRMTFMIKNTGLKKLTRLNAAIAGTNPLDFTVTSPGLTSLKTGEATTVVVTFKPTEAGLRSAALAITSNDPDESPFDIVLQGTGVGDPATN